MKNEEQAVNSYIEWSELNTLYGRVLTVLEAIGALPDETIMDYGTQSGKNISGLTSAKREAIKSLISDAIFNQDYRGFGVTEKEQKQLEDFIFFPTK